MPAKNNLKQSKIFKISPSTILSVAGYVLLAVSLALLTYIYLPVLTVELQYRLATATHQIGNSGALEATLKPRDTQFGILIPKLGINTAVVANVDPSDSHIYQEALTRGVAHAKGSAYPGEIGNVFIFSHSSVNIFEASRYNSIFYLLNKLERGDSIILYYLGSRYVYGVDNVRVVDAINTDLMAKTAAIPKLTLMTCWPPGTNFKRLVVTAKLTYD